MRPDIVKKIQTAGPDEITKIYQSELDSATTKLVLARIAELRAKEKAEEARKKDIHPKTS